MISDRYYFQVHRMCWASSGLIIGVLFVGGQQRWLAPLLLAVAITLGLRYYRLYGRALLLLLIFCLAGMLWTQQAQQNLIPPWQTGAVYTLTGQVRESAVGQRYLWLEVEAAGRKRYLYVSLPWMEKDAQPVWYPPGSRLEVQGTFLLPLGQRNPGGFDEAGWLRGKKACGKLSAEKLRLLAEPQGVWRISWRMHQCLEQIAVRDLPSEEANLALALLLGEKQRLPDAFYRLTQRMGIAHIFAVSGLHVGFVGAMLLVLLRLLGWERSWKSILLLAVALSFYCILTGLSPSAVRAALMLFLAALAARLLRPVAALDYLAVAAIVLLLDNPFLLWTAGFSLSFGVTLALLLLVQPLRRSLRGIRWPWLRDSLSVTIAAYVGSLPLSAWHFYTVSLLSPVCNLLLVPLVSFIVPVLLVSFCLAWLFPPLGTFLLAPANLLLQLLLCGTTFGGRYLSMAQWSIGRPGWLALGFYSLFVGLFWWALRRPTAVRRHDVWIVVPLLLAIVLSIPRSPAIDTLYYLDTGQGSCAVLRTADGETVLFDAGAQTRELSSCLAWCGVNHIEAVVLSHTDSDHITGLAQVLERIPVQVLLAEQGQLQRETMKELCRLAIQRGTALRAINRGTALSLARGRIELQVYGDGKRGSNSRELAAVLHLNRWVVAFPGDLAVQEAEQFVTEQPYITVWTVPHHGSRNSASMALYALLQQKGVKQAVISVGRDNRYGHPHPEVLGFLRGVGIPWQRTDEQGCVQFLLYEKTG